MTHGPAWQHAGLLLSVIRIDVRPAHHLFVVTSE